MSGWGALFAALALLAYRSRFRARSRSRDLRRSRLHRPPLLSPPASRGVASRAVALLRELAFTEFGINRLEIVVDVDNVGSRRVALCNGFVESGMREGKVL